MKYKWETKLDGFDKNKSQFQMVFPEDDTVHIYRNTILNKSRYNITTKYTLLMPSLKRVIYDVEIMNGGTWDLECMIRDAKNEEDLLQKIMMELI